MRPEDAVFNSPFHYPDAVMNSGLAMVANIGTDFYVDHVYENKMMQAAGLEGRHKMFDSRSYDDFAQVSGKGGNQRLRNEILREIDLEKAGGPGRYGSKGSFTRRILRQNPGEGKQRWWHKMFGGITSPEEISSQKAIRKLGAEISKGTTARSQEIIKSLIDSGRGGVIQDIKNASKLRSLGIAAIGLGFAQTGFEIGVGTINMLASAGRKSRVLNRTAMVQSGFQDSNMAYTTRQRAMRAIQLGQSGMKRAIGNEASYIRSYH